MTVGYLILFAEIEAVQKKLEKDIKQFFKVGKKAGKSKKEIKEELIASGMDEKTIRRVMKV